MFLGYYPEGWTALLFLGGASFFVFGWFLSIRQAFSIRALIIALGLSLLLVFLSSTFDEKYILYFEEIETAHPVPVQDCKPLKIYLATLDAFEPKSPHTWKLSIEQPECLNGIRLTMLLSCVLAWASVFVLGVFGGGLVKSFLFLSNEENLNIGNGVRIDESVGLHTKWNSDIESEKDSIDGDYVVRAVDPKYSVKDLSPAGTDSLKEITRLMPSTMQEQVVNWDGHLLCKFLLEKTDGGLGLSQIDQFKNGFNGKGRTVVVALSWASFRALKSRGLAEDTLHAVLEWSAECSQTPLDELIGKFWSYRDNQISKR